MTKTRRQNLPANITSELQKVESLKDKLQKKHNVVTDTKDSERMFLRGIAVNLVCIH